MPAAASPDIRVCPFAALTARDLHDVLKLRFDVFVLEQESLYPEIDGQDTEAVHIIARSRDEIVGVARILGPTDAGEAVIGRVAIDRQARGTGLGRRIVAAAIAHISETAPERPIRLGAQLHLEGFYASFGFSRVSGVYDDGGIPHVDMLRPADILPT